MICAFGTIPKGIKRRLKVSEVGESNLNYIISEIDQNTKKSPGEQKKLAVHQTSVKNHQLTLVRKTYKV